MNDYLIVAEMVTAKHGRIEFISYGNGLIARNPGGRAIPRVHWSASMQAVVSRLGVDSYWQKAACEYMEQRLRMTPTYHNVQQGSDEWLALRCGLLTASEIKLIMTPGGKNASPKPADNDKSRAHFYEILGQRITNYVEPHYISDDMLRGHEDEVRAKAIYAEHYAPIREVGFVTRRFPGVNPDGITIGYSPDGLVGDDGLVESKSRRQKYQVQTILDMATGVDAPQEFMLQIQTGLLVTGRAWCDFISYSGGMHMAVSRVHADLEMQRAILEVATRFEDRMALALRVYHRTVEERGWRMTERTTANDGEIQTEENDHE